MIKPKSFNINKIDDTYAVVSFSVNKDLFYFNGHFPIQAILPGVVQLGWTIEFAKKIFAIDLSCNLPMVKFMSPILPEDKVALNLTLNTEKKNLSFEFYLVNANKVASTGKVKLL